MEINKYLYETYMNTKKIDSKYFQSLAKSKRISTLLKYYPYLEKSDIKYYTNLCYSTIEKWYEKNLVIEYTIPLNDDEKCLLRCLEKFSVSASDLTEMSYYKIWIKINRNVYVKDNIENVLKYIYSVTVKGQGEADTP